MTASQVAQYVFWAQVGVAALGVLLSIAVGARAARPRYVRGSTLVAPLLTAAAIVVASLLGGFRFSWVALGAAVAVGAVVGFFAGRSATYGEHQGERVVKPSPLVAWLYAASVALLAIGIAVVGPNTASLIASLAMGCVAMAFVESAMHMAGARKVLR